MPAILPVAPEKASLGSGAKSGQTGGSRPHVDALLRQSWKNNSVAVVSRANPLGDFGLPADETDDGNMSFATEQVARIETLLAENPGVKSVAVGNTNVTYEDLLKQYQYWKNQADREAGRRPGAKQINLNGF